MPASGGAACSWFSAVFIPIGFFPGRSNDAPNGTTDDAGDDRRQSRLFPGPPGVNVIALCEEQSKYGAVETRQEAACCADLFKKHRDAIDGIVITLPNFGDERAIADTLRMAGLNVPVLVQATPDTPSKMSIRD